MDKNKICIISEGSYPIVRGGVSEWTQQLINELHFLDFDIFCLSPTGQESWISEYEKPRNVKSVTIHGIISQPNSSRQKPLFLSEAIAQELRNCMGAVLEGRAIGYETLAKLIGSSSSVTKAWLTSKQHWDYLVQFYQRQCSDVDFSQFFWTANGIFASLMDTIALVKKLPKADIYHSLTTGLGGFLGCLGKVQYQRPLVISEHGLYLKERLLDLAKQDISPAVKQQITNYYRSLVMTCYECADLIVPVCQDHADREVELGVDPKKIRVVINGVDPAKFTPNITKNGHKPIVGCFARIVPIKDQVTLIRASRNILEEHDADFIFAGEIQDEEYYRECQALVKHLDLSEKIKFIGHSDNMLDLYHQTDIFVLSSRSEGVPLALLEAMSCGLPSVCTEVGGVPEILPDTITGFLVPPGDAVCLANKISTLLEDATLRENMGIRARDLIKEKYTVGEMAQKILGIYNEMFAKETKVNGSS
jgi:glycosyltransferase involved in cell wall biosynthesis